MQQVLLQVVNHGSGHSAQLLHMLSHLGIKAQSQDLVCFVYEPLQYVAIFFDCRLFVSAGELKPG